MIERCESKDTLAIREVFRLCNISDNNRYLDYYFRRVYDPNLCLKITDEKQEIVATLTRIKREMMLYGVVIQASLISNVCVLPNMQGRGYTKQMMDVCIDDIEHQELITLLEADDPKDYEEFGFKPIYYKRLYKLTRNDIKRTSSDGCMFNPSVNDMFKAYSTFVRKFNGFYIRNYEDFTKYVELIHSQGGKVCAYYDELGLIQGYAVMVMDGTKAIIKEIVYSNSLCIYKLLNMTLGQRDIILLNTSFNEDFSALLNGVKSYKYVYMLARLNDADLFNRLYGSNVSTIEEAMSLSNKPLFITE